MRRAECVNAPRRAMTLLGMSGVGKTYISAMLERDGWARVSCDYEIGTKYLKTGLQNPDDIGALAEFIGKLGNPAGGGLPMAEFQNRQRLYYEAECRAVAGALDTLAVTQGDFVHDSTGSLCEIRDEDLMARLGAQTVFVYLKASPEEERAVLERAHMHPKPLFFPPDLLQGWLVEYLSQEGLSRPEEIEPDEFSRWVFPRLFSARLPKYQALADRYGVTVSTQALRGVSSAEDFWERVMHENH